MLSLSTVSSSSSTEGVATGGKRPRSDNKVNPNRLERKDVVSKQTAFDRALVEFISTNWEENQQSQNEKLRTIIKELTIGTGTGEVDICAIRVLSGPVNLLDKFSASWFASDIQKLRQLGASKNPEDYKTREEYIKEHYPGLRNKLQIVFRIGSIKSKKVVSLAATASAIAVMTGAAEFIEGITSVHG